MPRIAANSPLRNARSLLACVTLATVIVLSGCGEKLSREDFTIAVKDKTAADVQKKMGKPDADDESAPGALKWIYKSTTFSTGEATKMDNRAIVVFQQRDPNTPATVADVAYD